MYSWFWCPFEYALSGDVRENYPIILAQVSNGCKSQRWKALDLSERERKRELPREREREREREIVYI